MLVFLVSAISSLFGSLSDRFGRANLVVYGSILCALFTFVVALTGSTLSFFVAGWVLTFVEGVLLVTLLGPGLRGQVVVTADDTARLEERAAHFDVAAATQRPWRQMLRASILLSSLGYGLYNVPRYTINVFLPTYLNGVLAIPLAGANGIASLFGVVFIAGSLAIGFFSDRLQARKPFMLAGTIAFALTLLYFIGITPGSGLILLTVTLICLSFFLSMGNVSWLAAFTETAEEINPALVGTALAIQGAILRFASIGTAAAQALVVGDGLGWTTWWWVCIVCLFVYLPSIVVLAGGGRALRVKTIVAG